MRDGTTERALDDGVVLTAMQELRESGGVKRYVRCRFGYAVLSKLVTDGLATIDDGPIQEARVWLTINGRIALVERGG